MNSQTRKFSRFLIPAVFLLAVLVTIALILTKPQANTAPVRETVRSIETLTIETGSLAPTIPVFVRVTTPNHASLRAAITADVTRLLALPGVMVQSGDDLVVLDDREAVLTVEQRKADVLDAQSQIDAENVQHENELFVIINDKGKRAEHNRAQIVKRHKIRLRSLRAKKQRAESALKLAQLDLERTHISSPFTGQVTALHVSTGDRVRPGDKIIDLYDKTTLELTGIIPNRYIPALQNAVNKGTKLPAKGSINDREITAQLVRLGGSVSENSGGVDVYFKISSDQAFLQLGRSMKVHLDLPAENNTFVVPNTALYGTDTVYKVVNKRLKAISVSRLGDFPSQNGIAQSLLRSTDISDGDIIMITQLPNAVENLLVKVVDTN